VSPAAGALAASAFEKAGDAGAVALHGLREVVSEKRLTLGPSSATPTEKPPYRISSTGRAPPP
jgi:hypothetical protein